jgi:hypothetical protein
MTRVILLLAALAACGDNLKAPARDDAGVDAAPDGGAGRLTGCLDQPGVPRAPEGSLPCELVPPGLQL